MYQKALKFIAKKHCGLTRFNGNPFIIHPIRVSQEVQSIKWKTAALLHDTIEDTETTKEEIEEEFGAEIAEMVDLLSHRKGESYETYISRIATSGNEGAIAIKITDIADNLSDCPSDRMIEKSALALDILVNGGQQ